MQQTNKCHLLISLGEAESSAGLIVPLIDARGEARVADGCAVLPHKPDAHCHAHWCADVQYGKDDNETKMLLGQEGYKYRMADDNILMLKWDSALT